MCDTHPTRRGFLRAAGLAGAGVAGLGLAGVTGTSLANASDAAPELRTGWHPDVASPRFTLAVMPDTQYLFDQDRIHPEPIVASFRYLLTSQAEHNTVFLTHLGDLTQNGLVNEMTEVSKAFRTLDANQVAYSVVAGNHDVSGTDQRGDTPYLDNFGPSRFTGSPGFGGATPDGYNTWHRFHAAGRDWLVLAMDWRASAGGIAWANRVIAAHPKTPVILTTHEIVGSNDDGTAELSDWGRQLWDELINNNDQIFLTLNGHYWGPGRTTRKNTAGHDVHLHITNYQNRYYGGAAMIRLYHFDLARNTIDVQTLSPWIMAQPPEVRNLLAREEVELTSDVDYFSVPIDFTARFGGFDPAPARPARPAQQLLVPGTIAYWRFDGQADGKAVAAVPDVSGSHNDLSPATASANSTLTYSADYHPDQPGHGSLRFTGGQNPLHGGYLTTAQGAPLNANTFQHGYTFEAFFKIPADFDSGNNGWQALLSRWGESGKAGKSGGATDPQEPIVTLSLSGDRELQWCVYPVNQTGSATNWGHELPLDAWWHVAVVNDGRHTVLYVDGCPVVRNPSTPSNGLTTLNQPWLLGGYEYGGSINQVFNGWLGDVRIVARALSVPEFMIS